MKRTTTTALNTFHRTDQVTYTLPTPPYSSPYTTITLPPFSSWSSGLHWHSKHTEYLSINSGSALITLNGQTNLYTSRSGTIVIERGVRHEWRRAEEGGEELVVREWTEPQDGEKEVFFRNLSGVLMDAGFDSTGPGIWERVLGRWWLEMQLWCLFWELDNWPVFWDFGGAGRVGRCVEWTVAVVGLRCASLLGGTIGFRGRYKKYTPVKVEEKM